MFFLLFFFQSFVFTYTASVSNSEQCKLNLAVYYETRCPDSIAFITEQLFPTYSSLANTIEVDLVPYGKASYHTKKDDSLAFICQHGPAECKGNKIQACAKKELPFNDLLNMVNCMESGRMPEERLRECALKANLTTDSIDQCASSEEGSKLLKVLGDQTSSLVPKMTFVPWITLNGTYDAAFHTAALYNLKSAVCNKCQGTKPAACEKV